MDWKNILALKLIISYSLLKVSPWDSLVKNLSIDEFKHLSQEFGSKVLDLANQKLFYAYEYWSDFKK